MIAEKKNIRIATKSIRSVEILRYLYDNLPNAVGYMTFTAAETLFLLQQHFDDVLLGYPVMEEESVRQLLHFVKEGKIVTFMVDKEEHVTFLARLAQELGVRVQVCIDINVSNDFKLLYFGTKRSSLYSLETLTPFLKFIQQQPDIEVVGAMAMRHKLLGGQSTCKCYKGKNYRHYAATS